MTRSQDFASVYLRLRLRNDSVLRVHHVASILGMPCRTVRHLAATGRLRGYKTGPRMWAFQGRDVAEYLMLRNEGSCAFRSAPCPTLFF